MVPFSDIPPFALTITGGGESGEQFVFEQPEVTLGRIADNDLVLYDASVSRRHAVVYHRNGQFILEDLGSSNGTILNGYLINQPTVLCEGDQLVVGAVHFSFTTMIFGDDDDPTEIEGWMSQGDEEDISDPVAVPRGVPGAGAPMPYEGGTQTFSKDRMQAALEQAQENQKPKPQPPKPVNQLRPSTPQNQQPMGPPSQRPQAQAPRPPAPKPPTPQAQAPKPPAPKPQAQAPRPLAPKPVKPRPDLRRSSVNELPQAQFSHPQSPSRSNLPNSPSPANRPALPKDSSGSMNHLLAQHPLSASQANQRMRRVRHQQRQQMIQLTLWSGVLFLLSSAFFLIPSRSAGPVQIQSKPIFLSINSKESEKMYGYNKKDRAHPDSITFQFSYRNGRSWLSYRILSAIPVDILLNSKALTSIPPSQKKWSYNRHVLPRNKLNTKGFNLVTFRRVGNRGKDPLWGLTHIQIKEQSLPSPNRSKAKAACNAGYNFFAQRDKKPSMRYRSIISFQECMDYLTLLKKKPPLYKQAEHMVTRINTELDVIYRQQLQQAKKQTSQQKRINQYKHLLKYFRVDPADSRYQRVQQLLQQQQKGSGK